MNRKSASALVLVFVILTLPALAQEDWSAREAALPENPLKNAYFGETHVHTSFSMDAYIGGARLTPFDAYRFAKGEPVSVNNGRQTTYERETPFFVTKT